MNGDDIRKKRLELGLTQKELAELVGIARKTIVNYENGHPIPASKQLLFESVFDQGKKKDARFSARYQEPKIRRLIEMKEIIDKSTDKRLSALGDMDLGILMSDCTHCLRVSGELAFYEFPPGSILGLIENSDGIIEPNKIYAIETVSNLYLKKIEKKDDGLLCHSGKGDPVLIPNGAIKRIFRIVGVSQRLDHGILISKEFDQ